MNQMSDKITIDTYNKNSKIYESKHNSKNFWKKEYGEFEGGIHGKKVLDVGCGFGRDSKHFAENGFNVIGIDASLGMLKLAEKVPLAQFMLMDMLKLSFKDKSFDGIWCCASLLHVRHEEAAFVLKGFKRVLKQGGILFVSVQEGDGERYKSYPDGTKRFFSYYTENSLKNLVERAGFKIITLRRRDDVWLTVIATLP